MPTAAMLHGMSRCLVPDQTVVRVGLVQVVQHGGPLQPRQILVGWQPVQVVVGRQWLFGHRSPHLRQLDLVERPIRSGLSGCADSHGSVARLDLLKIRNGENGLGFRGSLAG
jgi:hypothetical protein